MKSAATLPEPYQAPEEQPEPMLHCPCCDARLSELRCKLTCTRCGYYMSCADFY